MANGVPIEGKSEYPPPPLRPAEKAPPQDSPLNHRVITADSPVYHDHLKLNDLKASQALMQNRPKEPVFQSGCSYGVSQEPDMLFLPFPAPRGGFCKVSKMIFLSAVAGKAPAPAA